jgi:hypothetical protein
VIHADGAAATEEAVAALAEVIHAVGRPGQADPVSR